MSSFFGKKLKELRGEKNIPQREVASFLEIDTATYCKFENGDRRANREQVTLLADFFDSNKKELLQLWSADKIYEIIVEEEDAKGILNMVAESISNYESKKSKV